MVYEILIITQITAGPTQVYRNCHKPRKFNIHQNQH